MDLYSENSNLENDIIPSSPIKPVLKEGKNLPTENAEYSNVHSRLHFEKKSNRLNGPLKNLIGEKSETRVNKTIDLYKNQLYVEKDNDFYYHKNGKHDFLLSYEPQETNDNTGK